MDAQLYPSIMFSLNKSVLVLAEFEEGPEMDEYQHPYVHSNIKYFQLVCREIIDSEQRQDCLTAVDYIAASLEYTFGLQLIYFTGKIVTEVIYETVQYQGGGQIVCAEKIGLIYYINPDGYSLYHAPIVDQPECLIDQTTHIVKLDTIMKQGNSAGRHLEEFSLYYYSQSQYIAIHADMKLQLANDLVIYPQFIQLNQAGEITGQFLQRYTWLNTAFIQQFQT
uniref:Uncharacterized protein n=1 Tax=Spironucleus salmonicida TaxID=348837 RepID=V6LAS2_9EUKA|eukprot:EST41555.1 Hypothetical protein SS50377_18894 [Spironucleus salmonicida]